MTFAGPKWPDMVSSMHTEKKEIGIFGIHLHIFNCLHIIVSCFETKCDSIV